jgi:hypothetical protein
MSPCQNGSGFEVCSRLRGGLPQARGVFPVPKPRRVGFFPQGDRIFSTGPADPHTEEAPMVYQPRQQRPPRPRMPLPLSVLVWLIVLLIVAFVLLLVFGIAV